jgi:hypothetical protein
MEEKLDLAPFDEWIKTLEVPEETYFFEFDDTGNVIALHPGPAVDHIKNKIQVDLDVALGIYDRGETLRHYKVDVISNRVIKVNLVSITGLTKIDDVLHRVIDKKWSTISDPDIFIIFNKIEKTLEFGIDKKHQKNIWAGDTKLLFIITEYNDPNIFKEMIAIHIGDLLENNVLVPVANIPKKFSIYTRRVFDKYTYEDTGT